MFRRTTLFAAAGALGLAVGLLLAAQATNAEPLRLVHQVPAIAGADGTADLGAAPLTVETTVYLVERRAAAVTVGAPELPTMAAEAPIGASIDQPASRIGMPAIADATKPLPGRASRDGPARPATS
ncbi:hypothetical protein SAMN06265365_14840 [Tistlia consotensis]|uniref:Uncharacterized protein n=1 Tax=Tistlia consotensis USBA 355 TaxID=560819 RepID=A0A1Y6CR54_9PROT|nr:hypothetical protein [Tistlia consotensis]SMF83035.1 hypothetical protein SAMN05428998_14841 [Tistlia consotensis USBA 355]SNS31861.1 hypothetical protein SAMN06265365_14840 [Tistlia consotensis]